MTGEIYLGYAFVKGQQTQAQRLDGKEAIISFLQEHLYDPEVVITDSGDRLIFRAVDGIDLYTSLADLEIDLRLVYEKIRKTWHSDEQGAGREPWEDLYDSIGLSPGEIRMRQRVKQACKAARTVADVAKLLEGTYFSARFYSEDRSREWGYFDLDKPTMIMLNTSEEPEQPMIFDPVARVKHIASREDIHTFILLDPPE